MTNLELAGKLRELAEVYEKHPEIAQPYHLADVGEYVFCTDAETLRLTVKAFGAGDKGKDDRGHLTFSPRRFPRLKIYALMENFCERVKVGTRIVAAVPEVVCPAIPEHEEAVYETRCPESLLEASA